MNGVTVTSTGDKRV